MGMKVFFDIITNHTADVIDYTQGQYSYRSKTDYPYKDVNGNVFDDRDYVNQPFPPMDASSFPYTPFFHSAADATAKSPAWLNNPIYYHNRGDSTFAGESAEYGDFVGLDDLFTERPEVEQGMEDIYKAWVDFGIDGFRIDTAKHVNIGFWQKFSPAMLDARGVGRYAQLLHVRRGLRRQPGVPEHLLDDGHAAGDARLRLPAERRRGDQRPADDDARRHLRRRRLLHRHRLERLQPADVPRQSRHGSHRQVRRTARSTRSTSPTR